MDHVLVVRVKIRTCRWKDFVGDVIYFPVWVIVELEYILRRYFNTSLFIIAPAIKRHYFVLKRFSEQVVDLATKALLFVLFLEVAAIVLFFAGIAALAVFK